MTDDAQLFYMYFLATSWVIYILFTFILFFLFVVSCETSLYVVRESWVTGNIILEFMLCSVNILSDAYGFLDSNTFYLV